METALMYSYGVTYFKNFALSVKEDMMSITYIPIVTDNEILITVLDLVINTPIIIEIDAKNSCNNKGANVYSNHTVTFSLENVLKAINKTSPITMLKASKFNPTTIALLKNSSVLLIGFERRNSIVFSSSSFERILLPRVAA